MLRRRPMTNEAANANAERTLLERALSVVTEVEPGEGLTALLMTLDVFLLLTAYYVIKPVREGLILVMAGGADKKAYLGGAIAAALLVVVPLYGRAADRLRKDALVVVVTLFFALQLVGFYALSSSRFEQSLGLVFFVWVGIFNMMLVAQFWAFANHVYSEEQGKRLFAIIGIGASMGAVFGAWITKLLVQRVGTYPLMLVSAAILGVSAGLTKLVSMREGARLAEAKAQREPAPAPTKDGGASAPDAGGGTFALVLRHRYLRLIAGFSLVFTLVNSNGEYMLGVVVSAAFKAEAARAATTDAVAHALARDLTTAFYGDLFLWVNAISMVLQTFVVSRLVRYGGLRIAFFVLPVVAMVDATVILALPVLAVLRAGKIAENAVDYSINNTVRNMLWLPTTTEMKFKAKQVVDTFFVRMGDVAAGVLVAVGAKKLGFTVRTFAFVNLGLVLVWSLLAVGILRENARLRRDEEPASP